MSLIHLNRCVFIFLPLLYLNHNKSARKSNFIKVVVRCMVEKRIKMIRMIEKIEKNKKFSKKLGVENRSHFKMSKDQQRAN